MGLLRCVFLFALACNLDTLVLAVGFGARGVSLRMQEGFLLTAVTTLVTVLFLGLGAAGGGLLPIRLAETGGGAVLMGMGGWMLLDCFRAPAVSASIPAAENMLSLSTALAFNNAGAGLAAGITGLPALWGGAASALLTLLFLPLGLFLGRRLRGGRIAALSLPLSGLLLILLGILEIRG